MDERKIYISDKHRRHSIRLKDYDYSQAGAYFITICTRSRKLIFGDVVEGEMRLNEYGRVVETEWIKTADIRKNVELDVFVVMPNHFHGVIIISGKGDPSGRPYAPSSPHGSPSGSLGAIIGQFKSAASKRINKLRGTPGTPIWQRSYYEHVIRNEDDLAEIREYIMNNLMKWELDKENLKNIGQVRQT